MLIKAYLDNSLINQKYKLVISGLIEKNNYCRDLIKLSSKNLNIIFTGYVSGQTKQELLSNCHLFILPSTLEGNSLSLNEALGLKKLCLVSDIPIHQQYQKEFPIIITFKTDSLSDFQNKLEKSVNTINKAKSNINSDWGKTAQTYIDIFEKI